jgi:hypothetical protein
VADDLVLAWQLGHDYALASDPVADALDDARHASIATPRLSYEERVAQRIAVFEACAERFHEKHGTRPWVGVSA